MKRLTLLAVAIVMAACVASPYQEDIANKVSQGAPLLIYRAEPRAPNSAGGVDVRLGIANLSSKTIKYLRATVVPYNAVGDRVTGEIRRRSSARIYSTGPYIGYNGTSGPELHPLFWDTIWYNHSIRCIEITRVSIEYMDGTTRTFSTPSSIASLLHPSVSNSCRV